MVVGVVSTLVINVKRVAQSICADSLGDPSMVDRKPGLRRVKLVAPSRDGAGEPLTFGSNNMVAGVGIVCKTELLLQAGMSVLCCHPLWP